MKPILSPQARRLASTLGSILLSLILAVVVWAGATSADNPSVTQAFRQPLAIQVHNQPADTVLVNRLDTTVQVRLTAPQDVWNILSSSDIEAYIDLSQAPVGENVQLPVNIQIRRSGVRLIERTPALTTVRLERLALKTVPVRVNVIDSAPLGYVTRDPIATPAEVEVSGPEPAVERVTHVGVDVWLRGTTESIDRDLAPSPLTADSLPITGVTVTPTMVNVTVEVAQRANWEPNVPVRVNLVGEVAALYSVSNITVTPSRVTLLGLPGSLQQIEGYINTEPIDITDATQSVTRRVNLQLPSGVTVVPDTPEASQSVEVSIEVVPITSGRTMEVPVQARGLAPGFQASFSPQALDVVLSGPLALLQNLVPDDIETTVNLVDLAAGTHRLTPTVLVPTGIELKGVLPETVEVQITVAEPAEPTATAAAG